MKKLIVRRALAYGVDCALAYAVLAPLGLAVGALFGSPPQSGPEIYRVLLINFSIPVWLYFILSDASAGGATLGKRLLGIRVRGAQSGRVGLGRALTRTAVKLLPWELVHLAAFGLSLSPDAFTPMQTALLTVGNVLWVGWAVTALWTAGRRGVHDFVAGTVLDRTVAPT